MVGQPLNDYGQTYSQRIYIEAGYFHFGRL